LGNYDFKNCLLDRFISQIKFYHLIIDNWNYLIRSYFQKYFTLYFDLIYLHYVDLINSPVCLVDFKSMIKYFQITKVKY